MKKINAMNIAYDFIKNMNPSFWDGNGNKPDSFKDYSRQYSLTIGINLEITFVYDELDGWHHCCDLVYESDNSSFDLLSGDRIDSIINITNTIMDLCKDY